MSLLVIGQEESSAVNSIQFDIGGQGGFGSLNYERSFVLSNTFHIRPRIGFSFLHFVDYRNKLNPDVVIPIGINATYGNEHMIEAGIGNTYSNSVQAQSDQSIVRSSNFHGTAHIGYRYQKLRGGFLFRAGYTPLYEQYSTLRHWGVITIGWAF